MSSPSPFPSVDVIIVGAGPAGGVGAAVQMQKQGQAQHWAERGERLNLAAEFLRKLNKPNTRQAGDELNQCPPGPIPEQ
jgi:thioredoxin reductase